MLIASVRFSSYNVQLLGIVLAGISRLYVTSVRAGVATGHELDGQSLIPGRVNGFFSTLQSPDRLWGPTGLLHNGPWGSFLTVKQPGREADHFRLSHPYEPPRPVTGTALPFLMSGWKGVVWIYSVQDTGHWRDLENMVLHFWLPHMRDNFWLAQRLLASQEGLVFRAGWQITLSQINQLGLLIFAVLVNLAKFDIKCFILILVWCTLDRMQCANETSSYDEQIFQ
jgi:hypothetical protein